ncbi:4-hydroxy-tetrahydrodipicolinate synthase [Paraburkholderia lycopersici]|uniref:4-hydroxy-tetrahydrodipicolinate synthase n=1 Tax=Paraburkholderia lycopersici TaxID=416944 RepID=A0A1G6PC78_9BURK|nr:4-hydroxy-tetrahydrodipicolinate synthase [Paraburkholderia lycopersici]SDC77156.1 4-hydroxy-tetrahydrodipicolinate synthase [Paraburkholderia lycopersici]
MNKPDWKATLSGVFTALVTPFKHGEVDVDAFDRHVQRQLDLGVHGIVPVGTTGEAATLTDAETATVIRIAVERARGRAFVLAGAGANDTAVAIAKARRAVEIGADGLLVVTPYYNKPTQEGLFEHFSAVASAVSVPVVLYSVPGRTGVELAADTAARLAAAHPNIVGIKEAGGRVERVTELRLACGESFVIHCGDDALALSFYALGADGLTSVASNLIPHELLEMYSAWRQGDLTQALRLHDRVFDLVKHLFIESNPVPVKAALAASGLMSPDVRLPLARLAAKSETALLQCLERYSDIVG